MSKTILKNSAQKRKSLLASEKGFLTVDYLFSFVLVAGFFGILFAFSLTLSVAEIFQYITYSAARKYMAAHKTESAQRDSAIQKLDEFTNHRSLKNLFNGGWFGLKQNPIIGHISGQRFSNSVNSPDRDLFWGVGSEFKANVLDFRIPFYGSTSNLSQGGGQTGFTVFIASYLGREPTWEECHEFNKQRCKFIKGLAGGYKCASYLSINDNGC